MRGVKRVIRNRKETYRILVMDPFPGTPPERRFHYDTEDEAIEAKKRIDRTRKAIQKGEYTVPTGVEDKLLWIKTNGREGLANGATDKPVTIQELISAYINRQRSKVGIEGDESISHKYFQENEYHTRLFREFCEEKGTDRIESALSADNLEAYKIHASKHFNSKKSLSHTVKNIKSLIQWAWNSDRIDNIPRNLDEFRKVKVPPPQAQAYTKEEFLLLLKNASPRMQLYLLMAVNCGYTQKAIGDLTYDMIDLDTGMIDRSRSKVEKTADVPQKSKLWPSTLALLNKLRTDECGSDRVILSSKGQPLVWHKLRDGTDKLTGSDSVQTGFDRLRRRCKYPKGRSFKTVRSTGSDLIKNRYPHAKTKTNSELFDMYLAHSPGPMVQSYDPGDWTELFEATDWVGKELGIAESLDSLS